MNANRAGLRRLSWGCRSSRPAGWINADDNPGPGLDIGADIVVDGLPLESNSIDYISSPHALQRREVYYLLTVLEELCRVLKPGGVLRLGLPDFDKAIAAYQAGQRDHFWCWDWETLSGNFITQLTVQGTTRTPINYEFAEELLSKSGFQDIRRLEYHQTAGPFPEIVELDSQPGESFFIEASKPVPSPRTEVREPGPACQVHLSWSEDPCTSLTVGWQTPLGAGPAFVEYRQLGDNRWQRQQATTTPLPGERKMHRAAIRGLMPASQLEYRVSADAGALPPTSGPFQTRTAPGPGPAGFTFAFLCDTGIAGRPDGNATGVQRIIEELIAAEPLFILGGGDYAYGNCDGRYQTVDDAIDRWFTQMQPLLAQFPFMAQYGNHEVYLWERFRDWAPRFAHPPGFDHGKSYSFDVGEVHFTALFVPGPPPPAEHWLWFDADLRCARERGVRRLIVYQHEPVYAHGQSHPARPEVSHILGPILERHRVDLHLSGHDQNYERTYPLQGVPDHPTPTSTSLEKYGAGHGVIYAKVSPGGKMSEKRNDFSRFAGAQQPFIARRDDTAHHYALVRVGAGGELRVEVYRVAGNGTPASLFDWFRIVDNV